MAIYTNYYDYPVELHVRLPNKEYFRQKVDNVELDSPEFTTYPFKTIYVPVGETVDTGEAEIYEEVNLFLDYRSPFADGVEYTNDSDELKIVFYRINGKLYNQPKLAFETLHNSPTSTTYDFDTVYVPPHKTVYLGDSVIDHIGVIGVDDPTSRYGVKENGVIIPVGTLL